MIKQHKLDEVENLVSVLKERKNIFFTNFSGINVKSLSILRKNLREKNAVYKVVKNNLFKRALDNAGYTGLDDYIEGPVGIAFVNDEIGEVARVLNDFSNVEQNFKYSVGVLEDVVYKEDEITKIATLPSKEVVLAQIMSMVNGPSSGIAIGINQIMSSLARGIKAVAEKNSG